MNTLIIEELEQLRQHHDDTGDENRALAYQRAIDSISHCSRKIKSGADAMTLKWIGKGIGWRIDQILGTHTVDDDSVATVDINKRKKKKPEQEDEDVIVPKLRAKFVDEPIRKVPVRSNRELQQQQQQHNQEQPKLTRDDATKILKIVQFASSGCHVVLCDSYRRGYSRIPILCFLMTHERGIMYAQRGMNNVVNEFVHSGTILKSGFRTSSDKNKVQGEAQFYDNKRTRIVVPIYFVCVAPHSLPFALARYTGPSDIWKQLQQTAFSVGLNLTEDGIQTRQNKNIFVRDELDLFQLLHVEYLKPEERG